MDEQGFVEAAFRESRRMHVLEGPQNGRNAIHDGPDVFWARGGEPSVNANMVLNGRFADPQAGVAAVLEAMDGLPFRWFARQEAAYDPLREALREAGFASGEEERCMLLELAAARPPPETALAFRPVLDATDAQRYLGVWSAAFGAPPGAADLWLAHHGPMIGREARLRHFVGEAEGRAVACGTAFLGREAVGVYSLGVAPGARRRGFGAAMTWRIVEEGVREGRRRAILGASREGRGAYARLGFRDVGGLDVFAPPPRQIP